MGIETEYGISVPGPPARQRHADVARRSSTPTPRSRWGSGGVKARWDYDEETPLRDARGFDLSRAEADPSQLTDEDLGLANVILTNGRGCTSTTRTRSTPRPEVTNPRDAVRLGQGRRADHGAGRGHRAAALPGAPPIKLYKNNTDNKGASYGTPRELPDATDDPVRRRSSAHLTPFFVVAQVFTGAGRVGIGQDGAQPRIPAHPARRLLRGRGRARDHAQAADHQHPRRAARRPRAVPPAARDHRRREPGRGLDLPRRWAPPRWCWR